MQRFLDYIKNNIPLTVVLAIILIMIVVLVVLLITEISRNKKKEASAQAENTEPAQEPVQTENTEPAQEPVQTENAEPAQEPVQTENAEPAQEPVQTESTEPTQEPVQTESTEPTQEPVQTENTEPAAEAAGQSEEAEQSGPFIFVKKEQTRKQPAAKEKAAAAEEKPKEEDVEMKQTKTAAPAKKEQKPAKKEQKPAPAPVPAKKKETVSGANGKWVLYEEDRGGYGFRLVASNGEVMLTSSSPYATLSSARSGIKTYQDNIAAGRIEIIETKSGSFFVQIKNGSNRLLANSADYKTRSSCENAAESIKRWAATAVVVEETDDGKK